MKYNGKEWYDSLNPESFTTPQDFFTTFIDKWYPLHMRLAAFHAIHNFTQIEEETLKLGGAFCILVSNVPNHPLKEKELLDIFYDGLTSEFRTYLDSCAGNVLRGKALKEAMELLEI